MMVMMVFLMETMAIMLQSPMAMFGIGRVVEVKLLVDGLP